LKLSQGDAATATEYLNQAVKLQPENVITHFLLAKALVQDHKLELAEPVVMRLAKGGPNAPEVQTLVGDFHSAKHDMGRAREAYEKAYQLNGASFEALLGLVRTDLAQDKPDAARSRVEAQLAKTPNSEAVLALAGNTYLATGDLQKAESSFRRVIQLNPSSIEAYSRLGTLYGSQHRLDEARKEFEELARVQPKTAVAATTMVGTIYTLQKNTEEARKQYERALALDPQTPVAANNLAWDYAQNGKNLDMALQLAQTAKAKLPNNANVSDTLGWVYYQKGLSTLAITSLEEATKQAPSNPSIRYRLGLAYLKTGDQKKARASLEGALKISPAFKEAEEAKKALATIKG
jgi:tetratricopeptide (TPR) repeat protein